MCSIVAYFKCLTCEILFYNVNIHICTGKLIFIWLTVRFSYDTITDAKNPQSGFAINKLS